MKTHLLPFNAALLTVNLFLMVHFASAQVSAVKNQDKATVYHSKPKTSNRVTTIVIDAGHGGKDPGATHKGFKEKDVTLKVAQLTGKYIRAICPDVKIIYTRDKDEFIELKERASIANRQKADLFLSIHCNAMPKDGDIHRFNGTETYVQDPKVESYNMAVAKRENSAILLEKDYVAKYDGFDPNKPENHIMLALYQNNNLDQSIRMAESVEEEFKNYSGRKSKGVKQAGFLVLKATTVPSILIETGYITHPEEGQFLNTQAGQKKIAAGIARAFYRFKNSVEYGVDISEVENVPDPIAATKELVEIPTQIETASISRIVYRLQILSSPQPIDTSIIKLDLKNEVCLLLKDGSHKCYIGNFKNYQEAKSKRESIKKSGIKDAFIVAFEGDKKIPVAEAIQKEQN